MEKHFKISTDILLKQKLTQDDVKQYKAVWEIISKEDLEIFDHLNELLYIATLIKFYSEQENISTERQEILKISKPYLTKYQAMKTVDMSLAIHPAPDNYPQFLKDYIKGFKTRDNREIIKEYNQIMGEYAYGLDSNYGFPGMNSAKTNMFDSLASQLGRKYEYIGRQEELYAYYRERFTEELSEQHLYPVKSYDAEGIYHAVPFFHQTKETSCWNAVTNAVKLQANRYENPCKVPKDYFDDTGMHLYKSEAYYASHDMQPLNIPNTAKKDLIKGFPEQFTYSWTYDQLANIFQSDEVGAIQCTAQFLGKNVIGHDVTIVGIIKKKHEGKEYDFVLYNDPLKKDRYQQISLKSFNELLSESRAFYVKNKFNTNGKDAAEPKLNLMWYKPSTKDALDNLYHIQNGTQTLVSRKK